MTRWQCRRIFHKKTGSFVLMVFLVLSFAVMMHQSIHADYSNGYIIPDSSYRYLSDADLEGMNAQVLCYARNEIYARSGRKFHSPELQQYFSQQYWYIPIYEPDQFPEDLLNPYEIANIRLIEEREAQIGSYVPDSASSDTSAVSLYMENESARTVTVYDADPYSYILKNSDCGYVDADTISQMSMQELCYARNEIYARHGRTFASAELQNYFDQKDWYWGTIPPSAFSDSLLNSYELANVRALMNAEYARDPNGYSLDRSGYSYQGLHSWGVAGQASETSTMDYLIPDSNSRYLTESDLDGMSLRELCYARNEIYARRGYLFQAQELRDYFNSKSWYNGTVPAAEFSASVFNDFEWKNIEFLQSYEYRLDPNGYRLY